MQARYVKQFAALVVSLCAVPAAADVIDFEDETVGYAISGDGSVEIDGFTFAAVPGGDAEYLYITEPGDPSCGEGGCISNDSTRVASIGDRNSDGPISISRTGGGVFGLTSFDAAFTFKDTSSPYNATLLTLEADLLGGGMLSQVFELTNNFRTLSVSGWDDLVSLRFIGWGNRVELGNFLSVDNIVVTTARAPSTSVPEPGTVTLLGLGLLGMGMARRRQKS